jgi:RNA polymerase sigma-70 factor (ECF subfamily)
VSAAEQAAALAGRIQAGEPGAEAELVQRYGPAVAGILRRATRDPSLAQDLYQDAFRLAIEKIRRGELREAAKLPGYLCAVARNLALEHYRGTARRRNEPLDDVVEPLDAGPNPLDRLLASEKAALVRQLIEELDSERDRQVLLRFYIAEEDKDRLCEELNLTSLHFNRVLFRARQRYKELYERRMREKSPSGPRRTWAR